jgi:beta-lactamase class A
VTARLTLLLLIFGGPTVFADTDWRDLFEKKTAQIDAEYAGQIGIFIRDWRTGESYSLRGEESWYVASGTKMIVAIAVMRAVDEGRLTLQSKIKLKEDSFIDGAGSTNRLEPGSDVEVSRLLEQMIMFSDNTATDLLIDKVGLESVNVLARQLGFGPITTLADVRRQAYQGVHPAASSFTNAQLMKIYAAGRGDKERHAAIGEMLKGEKLKPMHKSFATYYASGANSASLKSYTEMLSKLTAGKLVSRKATNHLLQVMMRTQTGSKRFKAGLPSGLIFAHKTGTQRLRVCDFGVVRDSKPENIAVISVCTRGLSTPVAEKVIARVSKALTESGFYDLKGKVVAGEARK